MDDFDCSFDIEEEEEEEEEEKDSDVIGVLKQSIGRVLKIRARIFRRELHKQKINDNKVIIK